MREPRDDARDVQAENARLHAALADYEAMTLLAAASPDALWRADAAGRVDYVNARWTSLTGLTEIGTPEAWRTIIHPDDYDPTIALWQRAIATGEPYEATYRIRKLGQRQYRWVRARGLAERDATGGVRRWVGGVVEVDELRRREEMLTFVTSASRAFEGVDVATALRRVAQLATPSIASFAVAYLRDADGRFAPVAVGARAPEISARAHEVAHRYPPRVEALLGGALARGEGIVLAAFTPVVLDAIAYDAEHRRALLALGPASAIVVPLRAAGTTEGLLLFVRDDTFAAFDESDRRTLEVLAQRAGGVIETARALARERRIAETFQRAALPRKLPDVPGIALDALYVPAEDADVGGDWYDAFTLDDGRLVFSIGDVAGKSFDAAVVMSVLRQSIRVASLRGDDPGAALAVADAALRRESDRFATAFVAVVDPASWTLSYASAGHPAAMLRRPDGSVVDLDHGDPPLGVMESRPRVRRMVAVPPGATMVLYTDGLIEATRDVIAGQAALRAAIAADAIVHSPAKARFLRDAVLRDGAHDDVAILVVTLGRRVHWSFDAGDARAAHGARASFGRLLRQRGAPHSDFDAAEVIFGELIGNVVRYAPGPIEIDLAWDDERPVLHVMDRGPGFTLVAALPADPLAESGRGLFLIATLGEDLRVEALPGRGSHVRVTLPVYSRNGRRP